MWGQILDHSLTFFRERASVFRVNALKSNCGLFVGEFEWFYKTVPKNGIVCVSRLQTGNHDFC